MSNAQDTLRASYISQASDFDKALLKIEVKDNHEPLVEVPAGRAGPGPTILVDKSCLPYLRKSVAGALVNAALSFNHKGYLLKLESAYRTVDEQRERFQRRYEAIKKDSPSLSHSQIIAQANIYTAGIPILAAHTAGAAVDVILVEASSGKPVNFGVPYKHGDIESITDYEHLSSSVKANRAFLKDGMQKAGFTNYPFEYWHYSIGDVCAAYINHQATAIFGPIDFDVHSKSQKALSDKFIHQPFIKQA